MNVNDELPADGTPRHKHKVSTGAEFTVLVDPKTGLTNEQTDRFVDEMGPRLYDFFTYCASFHMNPDQDAPREERYGVSLGLFGQVPGGAWLPIIILGQGGETPGAAMDALREWIVTSLKEQKMAVRFGIPYAYRPDEKKKPEA